MFIVRLQTSAKQMVKLSVLQYGGMGYASYLVMRDGGSMLSLSLYSSQLALNWAWTPIFFGSHNVKAAFFEICLLWIAVAATGLNFYSVNKVVANMCRNHFSASHLNITMLILTRLPVCFLSPIKLGSLLPPSSTIGEQLNMNRFVD